MGKIERSLIIPDYKLKTYQASIIGDGRNHSDWSNIEGDRKFSETVGGLVNLIGSNSPHFGIPHVGIVMPHVTAFYRTGDPRIEEEQETNWHRVGLFETVILKDVMHDIDRHTPHFQVGCPVELYVLDREREFIATSSNMDEYLSKEIPNGTYTGARVQNPNLVAESLK